MATSMASPPPQGNDPQVKSDFHPSALTPPTSEDNDMKLETASRASSVLSDVPMQQESEEHHEVHTEPEHEVKEEEQEEEIVPDHYYGGGKIPVFKPTMDQFRSFKDYVEKIDKYGMKAGIVKVIPPPEWRESLPKLDELVKTIKIKNPIMQEFMGTHGTYTQANIEKQRSYNLPEWKSLTEETSNQPPARRGERRRGQEKIVRGGGNTRGRKPAGPVAEPAPGGKRRPGRPRRNPLPTPAPGDEPIEASGDVAGDEEPSVTKSIEKSSPAPKPKKARGRPPKGDTQKSVTSRRMNNQTETADVIDEAAFKDFDFLLEGLDEFTPERCQELETAYWKSLTFAQPMYAADMPGSLFNDNVTSWNVAKLENLLDVLGTKVPGVNTAYLYMGMWKATFAWHLEDVDLYSINYIHFGAPKQWYSISQEDARRFEAAMRSVWPNDSKNCDQFLRHKTYLISPQLLKDKFNIEVNRLVHHEGEFVITYPYGYHSGYNLGYNCAESVNFALESWMDFGRIARKCECESDSVWVDVNEIERKLRGEPTPEYYEETDDDDDEDMEDAGDLPTPPASVKGKAGKKRKRDTKDKGDEKKIKKKIRIRIKSSQREPCALCPNDAMYDPLLPTDNGKKAHRSCALYTPETWLASDNGVEMVMGITGIDKARLELKCNFCRSKRGACFQCASKKCTRAFHATCAAAAGVQVDVGPVPTFGEDGTEYFEEGFDFRCKFHRPRRPKNLDPDTLESNKLIMGYAKKLQPQDIVQAQYIGGEIFAGAVLENRPSEQTLLVEVLPEGDRVEVEWKWLVVLNPMESQRPKPSAHAIPMPADMNKKTVSIENRQDGVPSMDEPFNDNEANKWAEFFNLTEPPQGYSTTAIRNSSQVKVDLSKPDQLYYYLGRKSTETKCRYTDIPASNKAVSSADFLDRVKPPLPPMLPAAPKSKAPRSITSAFANYGADTLGASQSVKPDMAPMIQKFDARPRASSDAERASAQANAFPVDAYYSSTTLPAAFKNYSQYTTHVRQTSTDFGHNRRPSLTGHYANMAPRPPSSVHGHPNLKEWGGLQPAAELTNSAQGNPYPGKHGQDVQDAQTKVGRDSNVQWTPPSRIYHSHGLDRATHESRPTRPSDLSSLLNSTHDDLVAQTQPDTTNDAIRPAYTNAFSHNTYMINGYAPAHAYKSPFNGQMISESPRQPTPSPLSEKDILEARER